MDVARIPKLPQVLGSLGPGAEAAEAAARRCLRAAVVSPFARVAPLFGRPAAEAAEKAAFFATVMSVLGE